MSRNRFASMAITFGMTILSLSWLAKTSLAQNSRSGTVHNIILVHGAWADGSSWNKVVRSLSADGYNVTAVQLPLTSLADDVATVERAIARVEVVHPGPVLLVGHSYGGDVITQAGNDPNVTGLAYVAAFAPGAGESAASISAPYPPSPGILGAVVDASGFLTLPPKVVVDDFAQDLPFVEAETLAAVEGPTAGQVFYDLITTPAWATKPTWYIVAAQDRMISPDLERALAIKMGANTLTLDSSHVPMLSHPGRVAEFLEEAAASLR